MKKLSKSLLIQVGDNIKKYRESKGLSQEEFGLLCSLHRNYISSIENGKRNISVVTLGKIAKGLDIAPKDLLEI